MGWRDHVEAVVASHKNRAASKIRLADSLAPGECGQAAEAILRSALGDLRWAYLWSDRNPQLLSALHAVGRRVHDDFGCEVPYRHGAYSEECPVLLAHSTYGFSIGGIADAVCSICGESPFDCDHITGERYDGVEAKRVASLCNICLVENGCHHVAGTRHDGVEAIRIITNVDLHEISIVPRPANPQAAVMSRQLTKQEILEALSDDERERFVYGLTPLSCHHCALCRGE